MKEVWLDVPDFVGKYKISNLGRVKSLSRIDKRGWQRKERIRKPCINADGYYSVGLYDDDGVEHKMLVHRLVVTAFVGDIPNDKEINHIDENKSNNSIENLEMLTHCENINYGTAQKRRVETRKRKKELKYA